MAAKLILVVVILLCAVSVLLTAFFITRQKKLLTDELYKRAHALAQNLAYNSSNYLLLTERSIIQSFVAGVKEESDIENVYLTSLDGTILASTDTSQTKKMLTIPATFDSTSEKSWFSKDNNTTKRMIVPVEVEIPVIDTDAMLIPSSNAKTMAQYGNLRQITFLQPGFNRTSDEVTFASTSVAGDLSTLSIMSVSLSNRRLRVVVESAANPSWSHNGRYLAFNKRIKPGIYELTVFDRETGVTKCLTRDNSGIYGVPCFTSDDRYVIVTMQTKYRQYRQEKLFKIPRDGGEPEQLTFNEGGHWFPNCSPDGKWILYSEIINKTIYVYNTETKKSSRIFPDMEELHWSASFSPDGKQFCYIRCKDISSDSWEVCIAELPINENPRPNPVSYGTQLTSNGDYKWFADWSPDGKWITYAQRDPTFKLKHDIWIVPSTGGDPINLTGSVQSHRNKIGYAVLDVSMKNLNRAIGVGNRTALIITLLFTGIGILCAFVLVRNIVRPVQTIAYAAGEIARGNFDQTLSLQRVDEIGALADSFDRMMKQLKILIEDKDVRNRELEKAYKELETLDKAKDDFLSLVSHELRTPLSSLLVFSEMLLNGVVKSEDTRAEIHTTMVDECKRLTRLINDVLDLSKIEAGRMQFQTEIFNIRQLVIDTVSRLKPIITGKNIHIEYNNIPEDSFLHGDKDKIIQVLENIMSNALKYTPEEGSVSISLTTVKNEGIIAVRDTGKGIQKDDIPRVFDRFMQLESIEHHSKGSGLGMAISKSIIECLGGRIWIESEKGRGTTVFFSLPAAERSEQEVVTQKDSESATGNTTLSANNSHGEKILIVDDEKALRLALTECLKTAGFTPIEASEGREALRLLEKHHPALVILDVMMPDLSGLEVCRTLKNNPETRGIKVIMLSARGQEKEKEEGLKAGADRYITKPFDYEELMRVIGELIEK